ncbi:MAG: type IV pili methyl-accepting chemotaxis transducer N-terminal domain-containing protein [Aquabacterium sp.]
MPYSRRQFLGQSATVLMGLSCAPHAFAQISGLNEAINKAGRQRMLSQRMAKAWLAAGQQIESARAERILYDSMALFDRQFVELKAFAPTPDIRSTYQALDAVWSEYKSALVGFSPAKQTAPQLIQLDSKVLALAHQGTVQLEKHSGRSVGKLVNIAGRQRMLSQRMAKYYLSNAWGAAVPDQLTELNKARQEFQTALDVLDSAPEATAAIHQELQLARQQWVFFDNALQKLTESSAKPRHAVDVFSASERLLSVMDRVTGMYSKLV